MQDRSPSGEVPVLMRAGARWEGQFYTPAISVRINLSGRNEEQQASWRSLFDEAGFTAPVVEASALVSANGGPHCATAQVPL